jgi:uncharacterized protein YraI
VPHAGKSRQLHGARAAGGTAVPGTRAWRDTFSCGATKEITTMRIAQVLPLATLAVFAIAAPAAAATVAIATTPLNIRSGPGPQYPVIGAIAANSQAVVNGCIQGSLWCQVSFGRVQGWVYSQYLRTSVAGAPPVVLSQRAASMPVVTYQPSTIETVGAAPPAAGAVIVEPAGTPPMPLNPPPAVNSYVTGHPVQPVILNGEVVLGGGLPADVALNAVPDYEYDYAYVNQVPVLVEPTTRRIVYIYR